MNRSNPYLLSSAILFIIVTVLIIQIDFKTVTKNEPEFDARTQEIHTYIQDIFSSVNIPDNLIPSTFPEGFSIVNKKHFEDEMDIIGTIYLEKNDTDEYITYRVYYHLTNDSIAYYEKDDTDVTMLEQDNINYYIFNNIDSSVLVWRNGSFETMIDSTLSESELEQIVNSIPSV